jgi:hypothetical protein
MTREASIAVARQNPRGEASSELVRFVPIWNGILHEFRNHLTVVLAAATEVRALTPAPVGSEIGEALSETEWNVHRMNALVGFVDAALRDGATVPVALDEAVDRAVGLAAPALGRTALSVKRAHGIEVGNRGTALECLISGLLVDLARAEAAVSDTSRAHRIEVRAETTAAGGALLHLESNGRRPATGSWRTALASDLATRIGATVLAPPAKAGFLIRLS